MKNLTIAGRLTKDADLRTTTGGDQVCGFSVAVDDRSGREKTTMFFDCALWGKRGEALSQHLTKGTSVTVAGDLGRREHDGKTYLTIRVQDVTLQGGKPQQSSDDFRSDDADGFSRRGGGGGNSEPRGRDRRSDSYDLNDDIPF